MMVLAAIISQRSIPPQFAFNQAAGKGFLHKQRHPSDGVAAPGLPASEGDSLNSQPSTSRCIVRERHGPGSHLCFLDDLPGPVDLGARPGQVNPRSDEAEILRTYLGHKDCSYQPRGQSLCK
jgi:hypothetical protein